MKNLISYKDIKEEFNNSNYLLDFLNDYYFYNIEGNIDNKVFKKEELEELLNEGYIFDNISEKADSEVDIYNNKLTAWLAENSSAFDDYIDEFGYNADKTIYENIQGAQYIELEREIRDEVQEFVDYYDLELNDI